MTAPDLKPCPFCGGKPELRGITCTEIRCTNDQCISSGAFNDFAHRLQAIAAWNRRAPTDEDTTTPAHSTKETNMNFGEAIHALKNEKWVRRAGWNGKGMHLYLEDHLYRSMPRASVKGKITYSDQGRYEPCIVMFTAQQKHQPGWLASQADMLAEDWEVVPFDEMK